MEPVRWKGRVHHRDLSAAQLKARLTFLRREYLRSTIGRDRLHRSPGQLLGWIRRYERWLDEARQ